ncbi:DUF4231 domain-containing protein [candidate division KSB1 bacterium]|nr:DUF4231 domain-containing protein [candidate division KSB1 bacterium]
MSTKNIKDSLVDSDELQKFIDGLKNLTEYSDFIKNRWLKMVMWWHNRSLEARKKYFLLRAIIIIGGVLIPVLSALEKFTFFDTYGGAATVVIGAIVAGCAAWEGVANYGEIWREKRRASELLKVEGWQFFQRCGDYEKHGDNHKAAFLHFAAAVENMIAKEVGEYLTVFNPSMDQNKAQAEKITNGIVDLVVQKMKEKDLSAETKTTEDDAEK